MRDEWLLLPSSFFFGGGGGGEGFWVRAKGKKARGRGSLEDFLTFFRGRGGGGEEGYACM